MIEAAELAARTSYGRLLSVLATRTGDVAGAEDALAEAFLAAVQRWPRDGVPRNPEAWLWTAARRRLVDVGRRRRTQAQKNLLLLEVGTEAGADEHDGFPDDRLRLLFVCAHPAIDPAIRTPLMLQTVLGLDAVRIAACMRVSPAAMGQRLWRAKNKIRDARIPFAVSTEDLPDRVFAVLEAIYAAYGSGWEDLAEDAAASRDLTDEAIWLARLTTRLLPEEPEPRGLLAVMLYAEARARARRGSEGLYVPLSKQDDSLWDKKLLAEAEAALSEASQMGRIGPFQIEAAIQSAHVQARLTGSNDDQAVALLYEGLVQIAPTLGALVARAVARAKTDGPARGLELLDAIGTAEMRQGYQPYWSARAHLLEQLGQVEKAREAYERAIGLTEDAGIRRFLLDRTRALEGSQTRLP